MWIQSLTRGLSRCRLLNRKIWDECEPCCLGIFFVQGFEVAIRMAPWHPDVTPKATQGGPASALRASEQRAAFLLELQKPLVARRESKDQFLYIKDFQFVTL